MKLDMLRLKIAYIKSKMYEGIGHILIKYYCNFRNFVACNNDPDTENEFNKYFEPEYKAI